jgi:hypothetical protein
MFVRGTSVSEMQAILRIAPFTLIAVALVLVGGSLGEDPQWILWAIAGILLWFTPRFTTVQGFVVSVSHFVERHGLVVLVALGESIVVIGTGAAGHALDEGLVLVALLSLSLSAALWRIYFSDEKPLSGRFTIRRRIGGRSPRSRDSGTGVTGSSSGSSPSPQASRRRSATPTTPGGLDRAGARRRRRPLRRLRHRLPADLRDRTQPHPAAGGGGSTGHYSARHGVGRGHPGRRDRGTRRSSARGGMDSRQRTWELAIPFRFGRPRGAAIGLLLIKASARLARSETPASDETRAHRPDVGARLVRGSKQSSLALQAHSR